MAGRKWTDEEIAFLTDNRKRGISYLARALDRTESAVYQKSLTMGLGLNIATMSTGSYKSVLNRISNSQRAKYAERKEEGLCVRCGKRWAETGKTKCRSCRECAQKWYRDNNMREYIYRLNKDKKAERRENNLCVNCGTKLTKEEIGVNTFCAKCRKAKMERLNMKRLRDRIHGIKRTR